MSSALCEPMGAQRRLWSTQGPPTAVAVGPFAVMLLLQATCSSQEQCNCITLH